MCSRSISPRWRAAREVRVTPTPGHTSEDVDHLVSALTEIWKHLGLRTVSLTCAPLRGPGCTRRPVQGVREDGAREPALDRQAARPRRARGAGAGQRL